MKIDLSYFTISPSHVLSLTDENTYKEFLEWKNEHAWPIRLPWGDFVYSLEGFVVDQEEFDSQEEVFTECSLKIQNLIYQLKQIQLKEDPNSKSELVYGTY
jgi:hypothetical protein